MRTVATWLAAAMWLSGCPAKERTVTSPSDAAETSLAELHLPVSIDGKAAAPLYGAALRVTPPDFSEDERRAWKLARLLKLSPGQKILRVDAVGADGVTQSLPVDGSAAQEAVLVLNRRQRLDLWLVDPADPFPAFHGRGGNRGRPGHDRPRVIDAQRLEIVTSP